MTGADCGLNGCALASIGGEIAITSASSAAGFARRAQDGADMPILRGAAGLVELSRSLTGIRILLMSPDDIRHLHGLRTNRNQARTRSSSYSRFTTFENDPDFISNRCGRQYARWRNHTWLATPAWQADLSAIPAAVAGSRECDDRPAPR